MFEKQLTEKVREFCRGTLLTWNTSSPNMELNALLGIIGESGEAAEFVKKTCFHGKSYGVSEKIKEVGDILYYVSVSAYEGSKDTTSLEQNVLSTIYDAATNYGVGSRLTLLTQIYELPAHIIAYIYSLPDMSELYESVEDMCIEAMRINGEKLKARYPNGFDLNISSTKQDEKH
jgi:hypothetical protein